MTRVLVLLSLFILLATVQAACESLIVSAIPLLRCFYSPCSRHVLVLPTTHIAPS